jgi:hypothetical protein
LHDKIAPYLGLGNNHELMLLYRNALLLEICQTRTVSISAELHMRRVTSIFIVAYKVCSFNIISELDVYAWENRKREFGIKIMDSAGELALYITSMIVVQ